MIHYPRYDETELKRNRGKTVSNHGCALWEVCSCEYHSWKKEWPPPSPSSYLNAARLSCKARWAPGLRHAIRITTGLPRMLENVLKYSAQSALVLDLKLELFTAGWWVRTMVRTMLSLFDKLHNDWEPNSVWKNDGLQMLLLNGWESIFFIWVN